MKLYSALLLFVLVVANSFASTYWVFTNMDEDGNYKAMEQSQESFLDRAADAKIVKVDTKVKKVKGKKFKIVITGTMEATIRGPVNKVAVDKYTDGEWIETESKDGRHFPIKIMIQDHDSVTMDDTIKEGYVNVGLPVEIRRNNAGQNHQYGGHFKLMYEVSFSEIESKLGWGDTPKLKVKVEIPKRLGSEEASSDSETVDLKDDGAEDNKEANNSFFDSVEVAD